MTMKQACAESKQKAVFYAFFSRVQKMETMITNEPRRHTYLQRDLEVELFVEGI